MAEFVPALGSTDWNEEWKRLQKARRHADVAEHWDARAKDFGASVEASPYAARFIELAGIRPGETVLDMGCGTGAIALPLARASHEVLAADFSRGMLRQLEAARDAHSLSSVRTELMSWEDDWREHGVGPRSFDVAAASRSIATADLRDSLLKLSDAARRRVCITLAAGRSPRADERVLAAIGLPTRVGLDFHYAVNILINEGLLPQLSYIESARDDTYDSLDEAYESLARMVVDVCRWQADEPARDAALARLREWLPGDLVADERAGQPDGRGGARKRLRLSEPRVSTWAFIAWDL